MQFFPLNLKIFLCLVLIEEFYLIILFAYFWQYLFVDVFPKAIVLD